MKKMWLPWIVLQRRRGAQYDASHLSFLPKANQHFPEAFIIAIFVQGA